MGWSALNLDRRTPDSSHMQLAAATIGQLVLHYVDERRRLGQLTGQSPAVIRYHLWLFAEHVGTDRPPSQITQRRIERWLIQSNVSMASKRVYLSAVRMFCKWLVAHGHLRSNPAALIDPPRQPRLLPPRALTTSQVRAIYLSCPDLRAELVVTLMVQEGLRAGGVANLQLGDIDLEARSLCVREKGGHERALPLTTECERVLRRYLAERKLTAGPLIRNKREPHRGVTATTISRLVGDVMHAAGVDESGHALRHTCASDMLERGVHVRTVQYVLGHKSLGQTQRYLRRFVGDLRDAMEGRSYRYPTGD